MSGSILTSLLQRLSAWTSRASSSSSADPTSSAEQELQNLEDTMKMIHSILEDAEEKDIKDESEQLHLRELREVAYDAEDVLDEYEYEVLHVKIEARKQAMANYAGKKHAKVILDLNSFHPKVSVSDDLAGRIKNIRKRLEEINDWNNISLRRLEKSGKRRRINKRKPIETSSYIDEDTTFGREEEKDMTIKWLLQEEEGGAISVLGIVGMGGLGKTTLAQMAYNDPRVRRCFSLRGWVYVPEAINIESLVKEICSSFNMYMSVNITSLDELHRELMVMLAGKKFFLVLDDVWNIKIELLSSLKAFLVGVGVGKVLVTTRDERFADIMQTTPPIHLRNLSFDDSWLLFKKIARCEGRDHYLLEIGKKIVHKCRGLPLAIKVLAGILRKEDEEETWNEVLESELREIDELENDDIFPVLKMSYDRLPTELRQCFMYLCLFPKGSKLEKSIIVQQWMSQGFIQSKGNKVEEDVGDDICNEFLYRSILQHVGTRTLKDLFIMHDLIHDLAQSVSKDEYLLVTTPEFHHAIAKTVRHVSLHVMDESQIMNVEPLHEAKHLRTLILSVHGRIPIEDLLPNLTCLRTLVLFRRGHIESADSIGGLKHLRYLDIGCPEFVPWLYNLHFLQAFRNSTFNIKLSGGVGDLINLRHIYGYSKDHLPREVAGLTDLQTLATFTVGAESDGGCKVRDLKGLRNLRMYLEVRGLETVAWPDVTPAEAHYLKDKRGIKYLALKWGRRAQQKVADVDERLAARALDSLQPHCDLQYMSISRYPGAILPTWLGHELPALEMLQIKGMGRVKSFVLPMEKKSADGRWFPSLEDLTLKNMHDLEEWQRAEGRDLPRLRQLTISDCPNLRTLPSLPRLVLLSISDCPALRRLPPLPSLAKLCINECDSELLLGCFCLPMLRGLSIYYYSGASLSFPDDGSSLGPLEELSISSCLALRSVEGLGHLTSLQHLVIFDCPLLRISPDERLPPNLRSKEIYNSPGAVEWYQNQVSSVAACHLATKKKETMIT